MLSLVQQAEKIARAAHDGVFRADGQPYITHPQAVATVLTALGQDEATIAAAWLHDVVEDTDLTLADLAAEGMPAPVIAAVDAVTVRPNEDYFAAVARAARNPIGALVKWADNWHNSSTAQLRCFTPTRRATKIAKYARAREILADSGLLRPLQVSAQRLTAAA